MIGEAGGEEIDLRERSRTKSILGVVVSVVSDSGLRRDLEPGVRERERERCQCKKEGPKRGHSINTIPTSTK